MTTREWPWWVSAMPSTNVRIIVTLGAVIATTCKVIATGWTAPLEWLGFLTANLGIDVAQFFAKRKTDAEYVEAKKMEAPSA